MCICKIIKKEKECYLIYESDTIMSFLDVDPINEGHLLIIPKIHQSSIDKIPLFILNDMIELSQKIVSALTQIYKLDGYSIMQNGGDFCEFGHFHLHIFPRYQDDGFGWTYPQGPFEYSMNVANKIINYLK
ncbi:MAG TPA: HIT family protein [Tenericutes bacterium]|nr:HIT family protein [Mycoplasmatota bacterium]